MIEKQRIEFIKIAAENKGVNYGGFVYVGRGKKEGLEFGKNLTIDPIRHPYDKGRGTLTYMNYFCPIKIWEERIGLKFTVACQAWEEYLEAKRELEGKAIPVSGMEKLVRKVEFCLEDRENHSIDTSVFLRDNGYVISVYFMDGTLVNHKSYQIKKEKQMKEITLTEIKTQFSEAQKFLNKTINSNGDKFKVESVEIKLEKEYSSREVKNFYDKHGYVIILRGDIYSIPYTSNIKLAVPDVTINGYKAEFKDNMVMFGCAAISKEQLKDAQTFLEKKYEDGNRENNSVKIGAGEFTLQNIKDLLA